MTSHTNILSVLFVIESLDQNEHTPSKELSDSYNNLSLAAFKKVVIKIDEQLYHRLKNDVDHRIKFSLHTY